MERKKKEKSSKLAEVGPKSNRKGQSKPRLNPCQPKSKSPPVFFFESTTVPTSQHPSSQQLPHNTTAADDNSTPPIISLPNTLTPSNTSAPINTPTSSTSRHSSSYKKYPSRQAGLSSQKKALRTLFKTSSVDWHSVEEPRNFPKAVGVFTWIRNTDVAGIVLNSRMTTKMETVSLGQSVGVLTAADFRPVCD